MTLPQEHNYNKAVFQFGSAIDEVLQIYNLHGLGVYNEQGDVSRTILKIALQFHARLIGLDVEINKDAEYISIPWDTEQPDD